MILNEFLILIVKLQDRKRLLGFKSTIDIELSIGPECVKE